MSLKPLIIVAGEPYSIFSEIFLKLYNKKIRKYLGNKASKNSYWLNPEIMKKIIKNIVA